MVLRKAVTTRHFLPTRIRSWLRMILETAAAISGVMPGATAASTTLSVSSASSQLRKSPTVRWAMGAKAARSWRSMMSRVISSSSYGTSTSSRKVFSGNAASAIWATARSSALAAATPASRSPERAGLALAIRSPRSRNTQVVLPTLCRNRCSAMLLLLLLRDQGQAWPRRCPSAGQQLRRGLAVLDAGFHRQPVAGGFLASLQQEARLAGTDLVSCQLGQFADLAILHAVHDEAILRLGEVPQHIVIAIAVAGHEERTIPLLRHQHLLDGHRLARPPGQRPVLQVGVAQALAIAFQAQADDILAGHVIAILGLGGKDRHHVFQRSGTDIDVDTVATQAVHQGGDFGTQADAVEMRHAHHPGAAGTFGRTGVLDLGQRCTQGGVIGSLGQRTHLGHAHVGKEIDHPGIADIDAMGVVDGFVEVVELGAEILELDAAAYLFQRLAARHALVAGVQVGVVGIEVGADRIKIDDAAGGILEVLAERARWHVLADDGRELGRRELEGQRIDLVHQQRLLAVIHDAGVIPVEDCIGTLAGLVTRRQPAMLGDHLRHQVVIAHGPLGTVQRHLGAGGGLPGGGDGRQRTAGCRGQQATQEATALEHGSRRRGRRFVMLVHDGPCSINGMEYVVQQWRTIAPSEFSHRCGALGTLSPGRQEPGVAQCQQGYEDAEDQRVVVDHRRHADQRAEQRKGREVRIQRRAERPLQAGFVTAQAEQRQHRQDVHQDRAEHRHGDDIGRQRLAADGDELVAVDGGDTHHAAGQDGAVRGLEAWMHAGEIGWQVAFAGQCKDLARVAQDDAVERRHQPEQPQPHQHVQPVAVAADDELHGLRQRIVDVGQLGPVTGTTGKEHHADGQHHQGQDAGDVGDGDGAPRILGLFGGHRHALDGEEEPDRERDGGKHSRHRCHAETVAARPAALGEVGQREARRHHAHEDQQFEDRQERHEELEGGSDLHAHDVERHEDQIGAQRGQLGIERGELHIQIGADGQRNGRRREDELDQRGCPGEVTAHRPEGTLAVGKRTARMRDGSGQFSEAEDEGGVHGRNEQRRHRKAQRAGAGPAIAPAEVLSRDHQPDRDGPELEGGQDRLEGMSLP
eukprot:TRINITY_DN118_c0_g3_i1.p1 TRINITY_DN118_c0_g3~~TRINITY_DN118_c0_g3_i1.p1  ORF type:complete len:1090 (-),score=381.38 TRINITY_DN118_c0_g3_i1:1933-5202(-)